MEEQGSGQRLTGRGRRAMALIAVALAAIVISGVAYLHPELAAIGRPAGPRVAVVSPSPAPPLLSNDYLSTYDFVSPTRGWALVSQLAQSTRFWIFQTRDGAKHWRIQFTGTTSDVYNGSLQVHFFDADHGFVSLADPLVIYRTSDGGAHWAPMKVPPFVSASADFSDFMHCWVVGYTGSVTQLVSKLVRTSDGGGTWTVLPDLPTRPLGGKGGSFSTNLAFRNPLEGWLGGLESPGSPAVYTSIDGGASWQPHALPMQAQPLPPGGDGFGQEVSVYLVPGAGVLAVTADEQGNMVGLSSFDGGSTWRRLPPPPGETTFDSYLFEDTFHWWAMRNGTLFKSSDAGQLWKETAQQTDEWDYLPGIIDSSHAWARMVVVFPSSTPPNGTGLAMSSDGGLRWIPVNVPVPP